MWAWFSELYSSWANSTHMQCCWTETGQFLARTCLGLLLFSPALEKVRTLLIAPKQREIEEIQTKFESEIASFAENQREIYTANKENISNIWEDLNNESQQIVRSCYGICLFGALVAIVFMTFGWDKALGPFSLVLFWPLAVQYFKLRSRGIKAVNDANQVLTAIGLLKKITEAHDNNDNNELMNLLKEVLNTNK